MFINDLGNTPSEIFKSFDTKPIAAASLAEVFKATTQDDRGKKQVTTNQECIHGYRYKLI